MSSHVPCGGADGALECRERNPTHHTEGKTLRNVVVAKGKLVNIVVS